MNDIDLKSNNNYLNNYIEYHFNKDRKKFSKLKFKLTKRPPNACSFSISEINNKESLPYLNQKLSMNYKPNNILTNKYLSSVIESQKNIGRNTEMKNYSTPTKVFSTNWSNCSRNNKLTDFSQNQNFNELIAQNSKNSDNDSNLYSNSQSEIKTYKSNIIEIKRSISHNKIEPKLNNKNIFEKLKLDLNKEIVSEDKNIGKKNKIIISNKSYKNVNENNKKIKTIIKNKILEKEKIVDRLYIGNRIFNNIKIENKLIYDIKPLNKTKEKGFVYFSSSSNLQPKNSIKKNEKRDLSDLLINVNSNTNVITLKNLKYFKNSYSQTNIDYNTNNIKQNLNEDKKETEKEDEYIKKQKNKFSKYYALSEPELIAILNIDKDVVKKRNKKNDIHDTKKSIHRNFVQYMNLTRLAKELSNNKKYKKNLKSFIDNEGGDFMRGEKMKFMKTCQKIKCIKPVLSQQSFKFVTIENSKKIVFPEKGKKFPVNHYKLDVLNNLTKNEIRETKEHLSNLKKNMDSEINNFKNFLDKQVID